MTQETSQTSVTWLYRFFPVLCLAEVATAIASYLTIPGDPKNAVFLGFSAFRLTVLCAFLLAFCAFLWSTVKAWRSTEGFSHRLIPLLHGRRSFAAIVSVLLGLALLSWIALVWLCADPQGRYLSIYERIFPPLLLLIVLCLEGAIAACMLRQGLTPSAFRLTALPVMKMSAFFLCLFLLTGAFVAISGWGITPDPFGWRAPGVPLLAWQVFFAAVATGILLLLPQTGRRYAWLIPCLLWLLAVGLWLSQPVTPSFFSPKGRAPNFEFYPYSDAGYYAYIANSLLIGAGFLGGQVVSRPLYIVFLAFLQGTAGQDYQTLITLQTLVLALFPVAVYLLGKALHSRSAGILAALLCILRELNTFAATPLTEVSHSKMLLTDLPTALAIAFWLWIAVRWLRQLDTAALWKAAATGGVLGVILLMRVQAVVILPFLLILLLIRMRKLLRRGLLLCLLVSLGTLVPVLPWLGRNALKTGQITFEGAFQTEFVAQKFSLDPQTAPSRQPRESAEAYAQRMNGAMVSFTLEHPGEVVHFAGSHFLNGLLGTLAVLPIQASFDTYQDNLVISTLFWEGGLGGLKGGQWILLGLNLILIAIGLGACVRRRRWTGWLPLIALMGYLLSNALARNSGWRFNLPVDWIGYFYFSLGVLEVFGWISRLFGGKAAWLGENDAPSAGVCAADEPESRAALPSPHRRLSRAVAPLFTLVLFLAAGGLIPLAEVVFPAQFPPASAEALLQGLRATPFLTANEGISRPPALEPGKVIIQGRALYPRFYYSGEGETGNSWLAYRPRSYHRLGFILIDPAGVQQVVMALDEPPARFPNAATVTVLGVQEEGYVHAQWVGVE